MINLEQLIQLKPPSKRWAAVYVVATAGGWLLSAYAADIANKLAPAPMSLVAGGSMTSDGDESGDVRLLDRSDVPADLDDGMVIPYDELRPGDVETVFDRIRRESLDIETP